MDVTCRLRASLSFFSVEDVSFYITNLFVKANDIFMLVHTVFSSELSLAAGSLTLLACSAYVVCMSTTVVSFQSLRSCYSRDSQHCIFGEKEHDVHGNEDSQARGRH